MSAQTIGVIGAGQMGAGIAQVAAQAGFRVLLGDRNVAIAEQGKAGIAKRLDGAVAKGKVAAADAEAALARIAPIDGHAPLAGAFLVIEAATERETIKRRIFAELAGVLAADAILATNTSSIPITRLAQAAPEPARFVGVHFFNPVPVMALVELIRGLATVAAVEAFVTAIGKIAVHAGDAPGFVVNRILLPMLNEAIFGLGEGVGTIAGIDKAVMLGLAHPIGPLALADFHRARHLPGDHARAAGGYGRSEIPAGAAARQICRSRLARPQIGAALLRLCGRGAGADALGQLLVEMQIARAEIGNVAQRIDIREADRSLVAHDQPVGL